MFKYPEFTGFQNLNKENTSSNIIEALQKFTDYIKNISYRDDVVNPQYFLEFFKLENNFENLDKFEPKIIFHILNLNYEISDIIFLEKTGILIIFCATNFEGNSVLNFIKFWKKKEKAGEILIFKLNKNNNNETNKEKDNINYINVVPSYTLINSIKTDSEISFLYLSPDNKYLFSGYFNGFIEIFAISDSQSEISTQSSNIINE